MRSRPALLLSLALAAGILAAEWLRPHPVLCLLVLVPLLSPPRHRGRSLALILVGVSLFGALRYAYVQTAGRGSLAAWAEQRVHVVGTVVGEPEVRQFGGVTYIVAVESADGEPTHGRVQMTQPTGPVPAYGERVAFDARLERPIGPRRPGGFDQAAYLARQSVYLVGETRGVERLGPGRLDPLRRAAVAARLRLEEVLHQALPQREAALLAGLLFGSRSELPDDIKDAFRAAGVFHLLAVSGGNVAMLVVPLVGLLRRTGLGKKAASGAVIPVVLFFIFLTGASPSVLRAGLMAMLVLAGDMLGRERDALNTLGAAATLLLITSPGLLFDLGFQLSLGATIGILLFAMPLQGWLLPRMGRLLPERLAGLLAPGLAVTFAAQALVEPLSLHSFGTLSLIAPLANLLVLALVELLVPVGLVMVLLGLFLEPAVWLLGLVGRWALPGLIYGVKSLGTLPLAYMQVGQLPLAGMLLWYGALLVATVPPVRRRVGALCRELWETAVMVQASRHTVGAGVEVLGAGRRVVGLAVLLALTVSAALSWRYALAGPPDQLTVDFIDVGQGDATLIRTPGGRAVLVDAGVAYAADPQSGRPGYDAGETVILPLLKRSGVKQLDMVILTHPDQDHVGGGAAVLRAMPVERLLVSRTDAAEPGQVAAQAAARERGVGVSEAVEGGSIDLGSGVWLDVLGPPADPFAGTRSDDNANCIALRLRYRKVAVMLSCDLEAVAEERLIARGHDLRADVLKVSHHGSRFSSTAPFLEAVGARHAVISAGSGNPYGHPHPTVIERLAAAGMEAWRTDRHGTVTLRTDGFRLHLSGTAGRPEAEGYRPLGLLGRRLIRAW